MIRGALRKQAAVADRESCPSDMLIEGTSYFFGEVIPLRDKTTLRAILVGRNAVVNVSETTFGINISEADLERLTNDSEYTCYCYVARETPEQVNVWVEPAWDVSSPTFELQSETYNRPKVLLDAHNTLDNVSRAAWHVRDAQYVLSVATLLALDTAKTTDEITEAMRVKRSGLPSMLGTQLSRCVERGLDLSAIKEANTEAYDQWFETPEEHTHQVEVSQ